MQLQVCMSQAQWLKIRVPGVNTVVRSVPLYAPSTMAQPIKTQGLWRYKPWHRLDLKLEVSSFAKQIQASFLAHCLLCGPYIRCQETPNTVQSFPFLFVRRMAFAVTLDTF